LHHSALNAAFTVVDLETTGLKPGAAGITEIAAIRVEGGRFVEEFHTLLNPGRRIPPMITQLTGISDDMVRNQPRIDDIFYNFNFSDRPFLVAHNADFDVNFLNFDAQRLLSSPLLNPSPVHFDSPNVCCRISALVPLTQSPLTSESPALIATAPWATCALPLKFS
jgi:DNA polymerase III epsilon subunit family exonuclease